MGAWVYAAQQAGSNWIYAAQEAAGSGAPVLTFPNASPTTNPTTADGSVVTNTASGTLYSMVSGNPTELDSTVKAFGAQSTVSAAGALNVSFNGLAPDTTYFAHYLHRSGGNDSFVASAGPFKTAALVAITTDVFRDWINQMPLALLVIEHTVVMRLDRTVVLSLPNQSTNDQGRLVLTGPGLVGGVPHIVANWNADGSVRGLEIYTPS